MGSDGPKPGGRPHRRGGLPADGGPDPPAGLACGGGGDGGARHARLAARQQGAHRRGLRWRRLRPGLSFADGCGPATGHTGRLRRLSVHPPGRPFAGALCRLRRPEPDGMGGRLADVLAQPLRLGPVGRFFQLPHLPLGGLDAPYLAGGALRRVDAVLALRPPVRQGGAGLPRPKRPARLPSGCGPCAAGLFRHSLGPPALHRPQQPGPHSDVLL